MHLKEDQQEYLEERRLRDLVKKHSEFIGYEISLQVERTTERDVTDEEAEKEAEEKEKEEKEKEEKEKEEKPAEGDEEEKKTDEITKDEDKEKASIVKTRAKKNEKGERCTSRVRSA